jgi:hypothetical protein
MSEVQISVGDQQTTQISLAAPEETQIVAAIAGIQGPPGVGLPSGGTFGQVPIKASNADYDIIWASVSGGTISGGTGTVTSVGLTVPTGLAVSGSPITASGDFIVTYASGYSLPTIAKQSEWDTAFSERNQWDGGSADLNAASGRTSLGLGDSAVRNVGTASGTVAAGNDVRFIPSGGTTGQFLRKSSGTDYDAAFSDLPVRTTSEAGIVPATSFAAITYAATVPLDMASLNSQYRTISLTGDLTFTTSNRATGRTVVLRLVADGTQRTLTFPGGWVFVGTKPANIAASKTGILSLSFFGTADTDCIAAWGVQS